MTSDPADDERVAALRAALPATGAGIYLNTGSAGPLPAETHRVMIDRLDWELRVGRAAPEDHLDFRERMDEARAVAAAVIVGDPDGVAITHSTTEGMNIAAWAVDWERGDRVVTTRSEHIAGLGPLRVLADRLGIELVTVDVGDGGDDERTLAALGEAITRRTRLVMASHVSWTTGAVLPIDRIAELAHARGAAIAIDGAQAVGAIPVDVGAVDFYAFPAQKWLLGPEGIGALHVAPAFLSRARQTFAGAFSFARHDLAGTAEPRPGGRRFETAGYQPATVLGMARSIGWLSMFVGLDWVHRRGAALAREAADRLAAIPGVEVITPRHQMAGLVSFRITGWPVDRAHEEISRRAHAIFRTIPLLAALRISVACFNTEAEIERFSATVALLAAHTPETLPARPRIEVISQP